MVLIIYTKNASNQTKRYGDKIPDGQKVWKEGMGGRTYTCTEDAKTIPPDKDYIPRWGDKTSIMQFIIIEKQRHFLK